MPVILSAKSNIIPHYGLLCVDIQLGDVPGYQRFLIDTSATHSVIRPRLSSRLGPHSAVGTRRVTGEGLMSPGDFPVYTLHIIRLLLRGNIPQNFYGFEYVERDFSQEIFADGIIGMNFLRRFPSISYQLAPPRLFLSFLR